MIGIEYAPDRWFLVGSVGSRVLWGLARTLDSGDPAGLGLARLSVIAYCDSVLSQLRMART